MPLNRDQPPEPDARSSAPPVPSGRQYAHSIVSDLSQRPRPVTPQNGMNTQSARQDTVDPNVPDGGRRFSLDVDRSDLAQPIAKGFKIPVRDTMQKPQVVKPQQSAPPRFYQSANAKPDKQENLRASTGGAKSRKAEKEPATGFDDTASLNQSMYDDYLENDLTTIQNPERVEQYSAQEASHPHEHEPRGDRDNLLAGLVPNLEPGWEAVAAEEKRRILQTQSLSSRTKFSREHGGHVDSRPQNVLAPRMESLQQPETPTRARSAPPNKDQLPAPVPRTGKMVGFAEADEIHSFSPAFQSSEMGNEDAFQKPLSRPSSTRPRVQTTTDQRPPRTQQHVHSQSRQNISVLPFPPARFEQPRGHLDTVRQGGEKVSAPDSDNQDFSEDERTQTQQQYGRQDKPPGSHVTNPHSLSIKRSHDDMSNDLDYSPAELGKKSLSALQAEAFTRDPRAGSQSPPTDSVGNEMTLTQILENLSKVPEDAQRETFKNLTDEQWARTGQWFVDKFQADLRKLTEIRLQRRHIAMNFEDQIRRRQRLVEHHEAEVDRELKELQTGGKQLVDGRKVPSGSRSGTPMKGGR